MAKKVRASNQIYTVHLATGSKRLVAKIITAIDALVDKPNGYKSAHMASLTTADKAIIDIALRYMAKGANANDGARRLQAIITPIRQRYCHVKGELCFNGQRRRYYV